MAGNYDISWEDGAALIFVMKCALIWKNGADGRVGGSQWTKCGQPVIRRGRGRRRKRRKGHMIEDGVLVLCRDFFQPTPAIKLT